MNREEILQQQLYALINTQSSRLVKKRFKDHKLIFGAYQPRVVFGEPLKIFLDPYTCGSAFHLYHEFSHVNLSHHNIQNHVVIDINKNDQLSKNLHRPDLYTNSIFINKLINAMTDIHIYRNNKNSHLYPHCFNDDDLYNRYFQYSHKNQIKNIDGFIFEMIAVLSNPSKFLGKTSSKSVAFFFQSILDAYTLENYASVKNAILAFFKIIAVNFKITDESLFKTNKSLIKMSDALHQLLQDNFELLNEIVYELNTQKKHDNDVKKLIDNKISSIDSSMNKDRYKNNQSEEYDYCFDGIPILVDLSYLDIDYNKIIDLDVLVNQGENYYVKETHGSKSIISDQGDNIEIDRVTFLPIITKNIQLIKVPFKRVYLFINSPYSFMNDEHHEEDIDMFKKTIFSTIALLRTHNCECIVTFNTNYYLTGRINNGIAKLVNNAYLEHQRMVCCKKKTDFNYIAGMIDEFIKGVKNRDLLNEYKHVDAVETMRETSKIDLKRIAGDYIISIEHHQQKFEIDHDDLLISVSPKPKSGFRLVDDSLVNRLDKLCGKCNVLTFWIDDKKDGYMQSILSKMLYSSNVTVNPNFTDIEDGVIGKLNR